MTSVGMRSSYDFRIELQTIPCRVVGKEQRNLPVFGTDARGNSTQVGADHVRDYVVQFSDGSEDTITLRNLEFEAREGNVVSLVVGLPRR
ncbi:MAG: hypothetical protein JO036_04225 [Candidatus Eremiobacteraeota bacterium]|nr:hypothetical protein [Candidatus Eremiobacteraeota bacterium]